ncbi:MAG: ATP synthase subunit I [Proteobacteria bacterium]|nr:ATP synthase subunit I [Pseudomonadota bacterium]
MSAVRDPHADQAISTVRRLAVRILAAQVVVTLAVALVAYVASGASAAASALAGGSIGVVANLFMTFQSLRRARGAAQALGRMLIGQFVKVALTLMGFVALAQSRDVVWIAAIAAYIATLLAFWVIPALGSRRLPPRSVG